VTSSTDVEQRLRAANLVPAESEKPEAAWSSSTILEHIDRGVADQGASTTAATQFLPTGVTSRRRGSVVAMGAALVVLLPVLALMLFLRGAGESDVATTQPPTTQPPPTVLEPITTDASAVPFYARFPEGQILHDEDWAVIVFHRPPNCIPPAMNLLDIPPSAVVEDCGPPAVTGTATWDTGPDVDPAPTESVFTGLGSVPVWLAPWPLVEAVASDGNLTRRELLSMQTRIEASATTYLERSGPDSMEVTGSGRLADGRAFSFAASRDGSVLQTTVEVPHDADTISSDDLFGVWENQFIRVEFLRDGTHAVSYVRSSSWANMGPAEAPAELRTGVNGLFFSEGRYELTSGVVTMTQTDGDMCRAVDDPAIYLAYINEDGQLLFDLISDECGRLGGVPLTRAG